MIGLAALIGASLLAQSPPSGKLTGTVVDTSDNVMPGVSIALRGPESRSTVTNRDGAFAFTALPLGDYELRVSLDGFATVVRTVTVTNSIEPLRIRLRVGRSTGEISGMVRDVAGALLAGVSVEVASPDLVEKFRVTTTGSDGSYRLLDLPDGTYSVTFALPGFWMARRDGVTLVNGSSATVDATMRVGGHHSNVIAADLKVDSDRPASEGSHPSHRPRSPLEPTRRSLLAPTSRSLLELTSVRGIAPFAPTPRRLLAPSRRSLLAPSSDHLPIVHGSIQQARDG